MTLLKRSLCCRTVIPNHALCSHTGRGEMAAKTRSPSTNSIIGGENRRKEQSAKELLTLSDCPHLQTCKIRPQPRWDRKVIYHSPVDSSTRRSWIYPVVIVVPSCIHWTGSVG
ncbi:hypothetical protein RRG08_059270 [Elysia crispata]|uniref:Uncharacterized protein n=1 Tax=Elysia crispata TaxID=231223 RepID=A0AAE0Y8N9_9GAST|nr:hypothetical protein RRG08_059270 [Elysia crispata]